MRDFKLLTPQQQVHVRAWIKRAYNQSDPGERAFERADRIHDELDAIDAYIARCVAGEESDPRELEPIGEFIRRELYERETVES